MGLSIMATFALNQSYIFSNNYLTSTESNEKLNFTSINSFIPIELLKNRLKSNLSVEKDENYFTNSFKFSKKTNSKVENKQENFHQKLIKLNDSNSFNSNQLMNRLDKRDCLTSHRKHAYQSNFKIKSNSKQRWQQAPFRFYSSSVLDDKQFASKFISSTSKPVNLLQPFLATSSLITYPESNMNNSNQSDPLYKQFFASSTKKDNESNLVNLILITIVAMILSLVTILGNMLVIISLIMDRQLRTISNYFLLSLSVADFLIGLISMPLYTMYSLLGKWPLGPFICDTWLAFDYLNSNASVLNLLVISFDRYFSVTRPLTYRVRRTTKRAIFIIAMTWLISLLLWPPWIFLWPYIEGQRTVPSDDCYIQFLQSNLYITFSTAIAAFYLPVTVMIFLYFRIWRETQRRYRDITTLFLVSTTGGNMKNNESKIKQKIKGQSSRQEESIVPDLVCLTRNSTYTSDKITQSLDEIQTSDSIYTILIQLQQNNSPTVKMVKSHNQNQFNDTNNNNEKIKMFDNKQPETNETFFPQSIVTDAKVNKSTIDNSKNAFKKLSYKSKVSQNKLKNCKSDANSSSFIYDLEPELNSITTDSSLPAAAAIPNETSTALNIGNYTPQQPKSERKAARTLSAILLAFIVTWTPYNVVAILRSLLAQGKTNEEVDVIPKTLWLSFYYLCYINSTINPLCYALCNASFRRTYIRILKCKWTKNKHSKKASQRFTEKRMTEKFRHWMT